MSCITYEVKVYTSGTREWYLDEKLHREDGPAFDGSNGRKGWYLNGERHRDDGPAIEYANGDKAWFINGKRHRDDGPAIEYTDGDKYWFVCGKQYTEEEFNAKMSPQSCDGKVVEIDGIKYELREVE